jgi:hypothetical protein
MGHARINALAPDDRDDFGRHPGRASFKVSAAQVRVIAMPLIDVTGNLFPIVSGKWDGDRYFVDAFLGTGFWVTSAGHFITCKHVVEQLKEGQFPAIGQPFGSDRSQYFAIVNTKCHKTWDIALGKAHDGDPKPFFAPYRGLIAQGLDFTCFGFGSWSKDDATKCMEIDARLLKGHVTKTHDARDHLPSPSVFEVSMPVPKGFSGVPLLVNGEVIGVVFGNIESRMQTFALEEVKDGDKHFREIAYRVMEFGRAHRLEEVERFIREDCEVEPFE